MLHIKSAKYLSGYKLWIAFDDGTSGEVDLTNELKGSMFEPLKGLAEFQNVTVDPELETIIWRKLRRFSTRVFEGIAE
ncbi:Protein of unknown function [Marinomonas polaris DSM 16579]|uniref:DUF2442 domain-containing protein n=1 Tax=Marinomonas polaris DSM 16579 TaxID=1122206 RepID=A0A1M5HP75_9GAMM|nr:DUF2442 domain-containing protein [Marinomonas polaris]SHG17766.1 Protein of unknown function [Marinomonas polaris DSM 16579]